MVEGYLLRDCNCDFSWLFILEWSVLFTILPFNISVIDHTSHQCSFEYPSWVNLSSPTFDCTANLQLQKRQRSVMTDVFLFIYRKLVKQFFYLFNIEQSRTFVLLISGLSIDLHPIHAYWINFIHLWYQGFKINNVRSVLQKF